MFCDVLWWFVVFSVRGFTQFKRNCVPQCYYSVQFMLWICSFKEELCATVLLFSSVYPS